MTTTRPQTPQTPTLSSPFTPNRRRTSHQYSPVSTPRMGSVSDMETPHVLQRAVMEGQEVPESPVLDRDFGMMLSPGYRSGESSTRGIGSAPEPRFLSDPSPQSIFPLLDEDEQHATQESDLRKALILRHAVHWGVERGDVDLVNWICGLEGRWKGILDKEIETLEDNESWGVVGMAVMCTCGRQEKEEIVRAVVQRWGVNAGPRKGRDRNGWTPLHLAVLVSTPPLVSFLLSHGASPHDTNSRGLTPLDLVVGIPDREAIALFLEHAISVPHPSTPLPSSSFIPTTSTILTTLPPARQKMLGRRRRKASRYLEKMEARGRRERVEAERERWVRDKVRVVDVRPELVLPRRDMKRDDGLEFDLNLELGKEDNEDDERENTEINLLEFNSNMLVFSLVNLPEIFDILISDYVPVSQPLPKRTLPANVLFYYARFAWYMCDEEWLEALIEGAVERVEEGVYDNIEDLAFLAFWAYNSCVLLHHLQSDDELRIACEDLGLLTMLEELVNAIHVFVIRIAERRIDAVLDSAVLDYETLDDFADVRFEGEWSLFRSFVPKKKRETPKASSIFAGAGTSPGGLSTSSGSRQSIDLSVSPGVASALRTPNRPQSMGDLRLSSSGRSTSHESATSSTFSTPGGGTPAPEVDSGPGKITEILTGVLLVLQLYDVNPALIVQAFSQIYFWIACELFNRILTRKKYLCRSKALQIRMNLTALDDWIRSNGLPAKISTQHLAPVSQLLQWLQCLSQIKEFDTLIGTIQGMKAINPLHMRRAVRDYRYEVNEGRMADDCSQYLVQLQRDWERRRLQQAGADAERRKSHSSEWSEESWGTEQSEASGRSGGMEEPTSVDALFDGSVVLAEFTPHTAPESVGELLDSRYMLPFLLPEDEIYLIAAPPKDAAYQSLYLPSSPFVTDTPTGRPLSRSSFSSSRPLGYRIPSVGKIRELTPDFFKWMKEREIEKKLGREALRIEKRAVPALTHPLGPSHRGAMTINTAMRQPPDDKTNLSPTPTRTVNKKRSGNFSAVSPSPASATTPAVQEADISTTLSMLYPTPTKPGANLPSPGLRSTASMNELREKKIVEKPFNAIEEEAGDEFQGHVRSESFKMRAMAREGSGDSLSSNDSQPSGPAFLTSPSSTESAGGNRWWRMGKGDQNLESARRRRDASEDTIAPGDGWVPGDVKTPDAKTPLSAKLFWG
ncbi:hypothetical protein IAR50_005258 [Cryptococcus sp. DSM 104548]